MPSPKWCSMKTTGKDASLIKRPETLKCRKKTTSSFRRLGPVEIQREFNTAAQA